MSLGNSKAVAGNQISAANNQIPAPASPKKPAGRKRFPIDRRTVIGARVAAFEHEVVAAALAKNGKGKRRPLSPEQKKDIRLACAYEALCARLEHALLVGDSLDTRGLVDATEKRDRLVHRLTYQPRW